MNPSYANGQAKQHIRLALQLLKENGRLTAVVPASFDCNEFSGFNCIYKSEVFSKAFAGTGVVVKVVSFTTN